MRNSRTSEKENRLLPKEREQNKRSNEFKKACGTYKYELFLVEYNYSYKIKRLLPWKCNLGTVFALLVARATIFQSNEIPCLY